MEGNASPAMWEGGVPFLGALPGSEKGTPAPRTTVTPLCRMLPVACWRLRTKSFVCTAAPSCPVGASWVT